MDQTNRHPVDRLADVRAAIAELKVEEDRLREMILTDEVGWRGDEWSADVTVTTAKRLDTTAVRKALGEERLAPYLRDSTTKTIRLKPRVADEGDEP